MSAVHLSSLDNVVVLVREVRPGETIEVAGLPLTVQKPLGVGHKLALLRIAAGAKIFKHGAAIGSATCDIEPGEHVHLHNMKSDYLPTYTLDEGRLFRGAR